MEFYFLIDHFIFEKRNPICILSMYIHKNITERLDYVRTYLLTNLIITQKT